MSGRVYYNENDPFAAAWLRELIAGGLIANGYVDERDIREVEAGDLAGFDQCHFFAGIGGWSYALAIAGWPRRERVFTGSCPCQPLSCAGLRRGHTDERHLWPAFFELIAKCAPAVVFGEQVASKDGREWVAGVRLDLESLGYAIGAADLCAASVGAPHIRQRLFWVADTLSAGRAEWRPGTGGGQAPGGGSNDRLGDRFGDGLEGSSEPGSRQPLPPPWAASVAISCTDGKFRRVAANGQAEAEPSLFPLAHGVPNRMGALRGAGNAIVPHLAAAFVAASLEAIRATVHP